MRILFCQGCARISGGRRGGLIVTPEKVAQDAVDKAGDFFASVCFGELYRLIDGSVIGNVGEKKQLVQSDAQQVSNEGIRLRQGAAELGFQPCIDGAAPAQRAVDE